jgi:hypothetical protein
LSGYITSQEFNKVIGEHASEIEDIKKKLGGKVDNSTFDNEIIELKLLIQ